MNTIFLLGVIALHLCLEAFAILLLWTWFIVPLGCPSITIFHAFGMGLFATLLCHQYADITNKEDKQGDIISYLLSKPLVCIAIGYFVHLLMG